MAGNSQRNRLYLSGDKFTIDHHYGSRDGYSDNPRITLRRDSLTVGCTEITREAWDKLAVEYSVFLSGRDEKSLQ